MAPAAFAPDVPGPKVVARNGTIYGQVSRHDAERVEVHYYHLWGRDCGTKGHSLDAEHVSALVRLSEREQRAELWYAAAHEDTVCDSGSAARAVALGAEEQGPPVWISRGKHGSFLGQAQCRRGCGGDRCEAGQRLQVAGVINIGEIGAPMNGALWAASSRWPLRSGMQSDFDAPLIARLETANGIVDLRGLRLPAQVAIAGGGRALTEVDSATRRAGAAVSEAEGRAARAVTGSKKSVKGWFRRHF